VPGEPDNGSHRVCHVADHVAEAASLGPVTVDGDPLVVQGPGYEAGNDHPVVAGLAGADGVEEAEGHDRQAVLLVVG